jgi:hypothetical protein
MSFDISAKHFTGIADAIFLYKVRSGSVSWAGKLSTAAEHITRPDKGVIDCQLPEWFCEIPHEELDFSETMGCKSQVHPSSDFL